MDLVLIAKAAGALCLVGLITSSVLATAARKFYVEVDERVAAVFGALPGSNCGACGRPSCFTVAESMVAGEMEPNACVAGGQSVADAVAAILGTASCEMAAVICARSCGGGARAVRAYDYSGVPSCASANRLAGGPLACAYGCLGMGDCERACPFDAIAVDERGLPVVDPAKCTGCGICVRECPRGQMSLLSLVPVAAPIVVRCNAHDKIKGRRANCTVACIACKKCERECQHDAIHVINTLAVVDNEKCTGCGACVEVCPQRCIDLYGHRIGVDAVAADGLGPDAPVAVSAEAEGAWRR